MLVNFFGNLISEVIQTFPSAPEWEATTKPEIIPTGSKFVDLQNPLYTEQLPVKREKRLKKQERGTYTWTLHLEFQLIY